MNRSVIRLLCGGLLLVGAVSWSACGGGGGGGGGGVVQPPTPSVTFVPAAAAGSDSVSLQAGPPSLTALELNVALQAVPGLYGLAFDIDYPPSALRYVSSSEGPALGGTGVALLIQSVESAPGHLVVGISRSGAVSGVASASGAALTIRFDVVAAGSGGITFSRNHAFDNKSTEIAGVSWVGGTVTVVR